MGGNTAKCVAVRTWSMCVSKGQTGRERDRSQGEEIVGSAPSFIAALMSPVTHRLETAVLFFPCLGQQIL